MYKIIIDNVTSLLLLTHSWYPLECCHDQDCASVTFLGRDASNHILVQNQKFGLVVIPSEFPIRPSQDKEWHLCIQANRIICLFAPTGS